jgi:hypothetical protein
MHSPSQLIDRMEGPSSKESFQMSEKPTEQEITDHLEALNRVAHNWVHSRESQIAQDKGIANLRRWFRDRRILIHEEKGEWKLQEVLDDIGVKQDG